MVFSSAFRAKRHTPTRVSKSVHQRPVLRPGSESLRWQRAIGLLIDPSAAATDDQAETVTLESATLCAALRVAQFGTANEIRVDLVLPIEGWIIGGKPRYAVNHAESCNIERMESRSSLLS